MPRELRVTERPPRKREGAGLSPVLGSTRMQLLKIAARAAAIRRAVRGPGVQRVEHSVGIREVVGSSPIRPSTHP